MSEKRTVRTGDKFTLVTKQGNIDAVASKVENGVIYFSLGGIPYTIETDHEYVQPYVGGGPLNE